MWDGNIIRMSLLLYAGAINLTGFTLMYIDKRRAQHHKWRVRERNLLAVAVLGGSIGSIAGMQIFHHKTKHPKFYIGIPTILIVQVFILIGWYLKLR
ncbi:DUF1294 domain-containing protein [Anaeromicropila populeti]|uniref:Uncharacterized membrane protein YsdA, DUF1294 family n=1 Tax=Anaeromicropila populeti TaxID=37658 RepID=A0A1I6IRB4_9FIRM|nr:DUF1294 domain-containing protein [Anaeromicropila populeti]SFR69258.1 Uncharacterized membrane protein YsdA, DUF1294 family [Anaeromicropila populeti]